MFRKRRGWGEGAIGLRKDGRWEARLSLGIGPDGKRIRLVAYAASKKLAQDALMELRKKGPNICNDPHITFGKFAEQWFENSVKVNKSPKTVQQYDDTLRLYVLPYLGHIKLGKLTANDVEYALKVMSTKGVSPRNRQLVYERIRQILNVALKRDMIAKNPMRSVERPKAPRKKELILSLAEALHFLQISADNKYYAVFLTLLTMGLRPSEALGLRWENVDLVKRYIDVCGALTTDQRGKLIFGEVKTREKGVRRLPIPPILVDALRRHRRKSRRISPWVFTNRKGNPIDIHRFRDRVFLPLVKKAELPHITLRSLRHVANTILVEHGVSMKVAQERLGHTTMRMTADTYTHISPDAQVEATRKIQELFAQNGRKMGVKQR